MAFETVSAVRRRRSGLSETHISLSLHSHGHVAFYIPHTLMRRLNWNSGTRIQVAEGTGADFGCLELQDKVSGYKLNVQTNGSGTFKLSPAALKHYPVEVGPCHSAVSVETQAFGGKATIMVPPWLLCGKEN